MWLKIHNHLDKIILLRDRDINYIKGVNVDVIIATFLYSKGVVVECSESMLDVARLLATKADCDEVVFIKDGKVYVCKLDDPIATSDSEADWLEFKQQQDLLNATRLELKDLLPTMDLSKHQDNTYPGVNNKAFEVTIDTTDFPKKPDNNEYVIGSDPIKINNPFDVAIKRETNKTIIGKPVKRDYFSEAGRKQDVHCNTCAKQTIICHKSCIGYSGKKWNYEEKDLSKGDPFALTKNDVASIKLKDEMHIVTGLKPCVDCSKAVNTRDVEGNKALMCNEKCYHTGTGEYSQFTSKVK